MYTREACVFLCMNVCVRREGLQQNMVAWNLSLQQERGRERGTLYEDCKRKKLNNKDMIRQQYYRGKVLTDKKSKRKCIFRKRCVCVRKRKKSFMVSVGLGSSRITTAGVYNHNLCNSINVCICISSILCFWGHP